VQLLQDIAMMQAVLEHESERGRRQSQIENANRPSKNDVKKLITKLDETLRQKEMFESMPSPTTKVPFQPSPIRKTSSSSKKTKTKSTGIDISPLRVNKNRVVYSPDKDECKDVERSFEVEESKNDFLSSNNNNGKQKTKSRTRSLLQTHVSKGKLEEGLEDDDLKFFI